MATQTLTPTHHRWPVARRFSRPAAVTLFASVGALIGLSMTAPAPAHADPETTTLLNDVGIGNNSAISQAIAQVATSLCPLLVQPGSQVVSTATTATGNGGLGSQLAGGVAGLVIQSQCPNFMTSLANGDFSVLTNAGSMLGMATPGANPLSSLTGAGTAGANPLSSLTGAAPPSPLGGFTVPGT
ncbi:DUF732 domain-containing protein [Mycolicibacterium sp. P9-64]|uniref:DUF732 domain-containing protein n=1 Tax=Mycolicibacterium sp. P9-64 TaxID=2024612 RepID=UPI0011ED9BB7|nr:DUF732 domain-containing protein [Mycolicibacterium sp. P9-64]KAA0077216.1 DUF732 domain-containing protein [Mycolicibacterium sp. P9-64]